jgi:hypothetical protein
MCCGGFSGPLDLAVSSHLIPLMVINNGPFRVARLVALSRLGQVVSEGAW